MWRPAGSRFGAAALALAAACWSGKAEPTTAAGGGTAQAQTQADVTGHYTCAFTQDGHEYPTYSCVIKRVGDRLVLQKLGGWRRVRGVVALDGRAFELTGVVYCPDGDCEESVTVRFQPIGRGGFTGTFDDATELTLTPAPRAALGGAGYGGSEYGDESDDEYGGLGYGGRYYRIDKRARPRP